MSGDRVAVMAVFRNVCFTINNPVAHVEFSEKMAYLVYQEEIGESGTPHYQGYVEFKTQVAASTAEALLGGHAHMERRRGTQAQAIAYCKKDDTRKPDTVPIEHGEAKAQGKRVDLEAFKEEVKAGKRKRDLFDEHLMTLARYPKLYNDLAMTYRPQRGDGEEDQLKVTLLYGGTGRGKTRAVMDEHGKDPELYIAPLNNGTQWWDGYDGQKFVLMDDFCGKMSHLPLASLLRLIDRYPVQVPTKGGHTWWLPNHIFVTTNILPRDWYNWKNRMSQYEALARRFTAVHVYYGPEKGCIGPTGFYVADADWWDKNAPDPLQGDQEEEPREEGSLCPSTPPKEPVTRRRRTISSENRPSFDFSERAPVPLPPSPFERRTGSSVTLPGQK